MHDVSWMGEAAEEVQVYEQETYGEAVKQVKSLVQQHEQGLILNSELLTCLRMVLRG